MDGLAVERACAQFYLVVVNSGIEIPYRQQEECEGSGYSMAMEAWEIMATDRKNLVWDCANQCLVRSIVVLGRSVRMLGSNS